MNVDDNRFIINNKLIRSNAITSFHRINFITLVKKQELWFGSKKVGFNPRGQILCTVGFFYGHA